MKTLGFARDGINIAWLVLVGATAIGWLLGNATKSSPDGIQLATAGVVVTAFVKVWVVGFQFMELRHAPRWLRFGFDAWGGATAVALLFLCLT